MAFSDEIASAGGLYAFVELAAGRRLACVQGAVWTLSYFLYLPFTVTELVYDQIPASFPGIRAYQTPIEVAAPVPLVAAVLAAERGLMAAMVAGAAVQIGLSLALGAVVLNHSGSGAGAFAAHGDARDLASGAGNVSLLFVCAGLPLFLGGEVAGGGRTLRRTIAHRRVRSRGGHGRLDLPARLAGLRPRRLGGARVRAGEGVRR